MARRPKKTLMARYDVTGLPRSELDSLWSEVQAQAEYSDPSFGGEMPDGHRDVDCHIMVIDNKTAGSRAELAKVIRDAFLAGNDAEAIVMLHEFVQPEFRLELYRKVRRWLLASGVAASVVDQQANELLDIVFAP